MTDELGLACVKIKAKLTDVKSVNIMILIG